MGRKIKKPGLVQKILIFVNFLLFIVGVMILLGGLAMRDPKEFKKILKKLFEATNQNVPEELMKIVSILVANGSQAIGTGLTITGGIVSVVSFAGCTGACCSRTLLKFYRYCLMFVMLIIIVVFQVGLKTQVKNMPRILGMLFAKYFAHFNQPIANKLIHITQMKGNCCGIYGPDSWENNKQWKQSIASRPMKGSNPVPMSCCRPQFFAPGCGLQNDFTYADKNAEIIKNFDGVTLNDLNKWKTEYRKEEEKQAANSFEDFIPADQKFDSSEYTKFESADYTAWDEYSKGVQNGTISGNQKNFTTFYQVKNPEARIQARTMVEQNARFTNVDMDQQGFVEGQIIFHEGCAIRFGVMIARISPRVNYYTIVSVMPFLIAILMTMKVERYFKKKENEF